MAVKTVSLVKVTEEAIAGGLGAPSLSVVMNVHSNANKITTTGSM